MGCKKNKKNELAPFNNGTSYRKDAIKAARDLRYGDEVIEKLKAAESDSEITRIMKDARKKRFRMDEEF